MAITAVIRSGSIVQRGSLTSDISLDLQPGDLTIRPTAKAVTVSKVSGMTGTPKQPARNFPAIPVEFQQLDGAGMLFLLTFRLSMDSVFDLCYQGVPILTFHQLFDDLDRDGAVGVADYAAFAPALDKAEGDEGYQAGLDLNDDGYIDAGDVYTSRSYRPSTQWTYTA